MRCTGPYTRVLFDTSDAKAAKAVIKALEDCAGALDVRHLPQGTNGLEDFALDADFPDPQGVGKWEVRAAKYLGPKKLLGQSHIFDAALRHRAADGQLLSEGYVFAARLKDLSAELARVLPLLLMDQPADGVFSREDAEIHRVELCTGEPL